MPAAAAITELLDAWSDGEEAAREELIARIYPELRRIAANQMKRDRQTNSLQPTELVHEVYLRMLGDVDVAWRNRRHFFAIASRVMRRILVDRARARRAKKRDAIRVTLNDSDNVTPGLDVDMMALDESLTLLQKRYPLPAKVVELRFFGGLTIAEAAEQLDVSHAGVERAWSFARAWLYRRLGT